MTTVRELEQLLFAAFPAEDATSDDRIGLLVGDAEAEVRGIALGLDAKVATIEAAAAEGCNVLVTHHPVFWYPPTEFLRVGPSEGASIYRAAERGVALIAMHTNLDCAPVAREMLLEPVGFAYSAPLALPGETDSELKLQGKTLEGVETFKLAGQMPTAPDDRQPPMTQGAAQPIAALGQIGRPRGKEAVSLCELAARYKKAFGAVAKVWGDPDKPVERLAACSGGASSLIQRVLNTRADCFVTGEVAYHEALELAAADIALIELGHDRSELPYRYYLQKALSAAGFAESTLTILGPTISWWQ